MQQNYIQINLYCIRRGECFYSEFFQTWNFPLLSQSSGRSLTLFVVYLHRTIQNTISDLNIICGYIIVIIIDNYSQKMFVPIIILNIVSVYIM